MNGLADDDPAAIHAYWFFPPAPRGLIVRFHGTGGNGSASFVRTEYLKFTRDAIADGFAIVSVDSNDRVNKKWSVLTRPRRPEANVDVATLLTLLAQLESTGQLDPGLPMYASGMSDGAGAALRFAYLLGIEIPIPGL